MGIDKRSSPRTIYVVEVQFGDHDLYHRGRIADISPNGIFIDTMSPWPEGSRIFFRFRLPDTAQGRIVSGEGKVAWDQRQVGMGIQFTSISEEDLSWIQRCFPG